MSSGILLVGHGTRDETGAAEFHQLVQELRQMVGDRPVEGCFLELRPPTIADAWRRIAETGVTHVDVAPLLLFSAGHAKQDIPAAVKQHASETFHISVDFAQPLSRHPLLIELAVERAHQAWREISGAVAESTPDRVALVVVGRGSYDPCAQSDMRLLTELVGRRLPFARVETAFYAMAHPSLPEVLERLAASTGVQRVIVQPHLLFQGAIRNSIRHQVAEASERHPDVAFAMSSHLGPDRRIAAAIVDRVERCVHTNV